jgi:hypothetical protein
MKKLTTKIMVSSIAGLVVLAIVLEIIILTNRRYTNQFSEVAQVSSAQISIQANRRQTTVPLTNFDKVVVEGPNTIKITPGNFQVTPLTPSYDAAIYVSDHTLYVKGLASSKEVVSIQLPKLTALKASGAASITIEKLHLTEPITFSLAGMSSLKVSNSKLNHLILKSAGLTSIEFNDCQLQQVTLDIRGMTNIVLDKLVAGSLQGTAFGSGNITYTGTLVSNSLKTSGAIQLQNK